MISCTLGLAECQSTQGLLCATRSTADSQAKTSAPGVNEVVNGSQRNRDVLYCLCSNSQSASQKRDQQVELRHRRVLHCIASDLAETLRCANFTYLSPPFWSERMQESVVCGDAQLGRSLVLGEPETSKLNCATFHRIASGLASAFRCTSLAYLCLANGAQELPCGSCITCKQRLNSCHCTQARYDPHRPIFLFRA